MTMPKQIDVKVTNPQYKHGQGRTRKCPIGSDLYCFTLWVALFMCKVHIAFNISTLTTVSDTSVKRN